VLFPFWIKLEDVQNIPNFNFILQTGLMGDLIFLFDQVKLLLDGWIILVLIFSDLEQNFNYILDSLVNVRLM
jgi:hypothetical protein